MPPFPQSPAQNKAGAAPPPRPLLCKRIKLADAVAGACGGEIAPANKVPRSVDLQYRSSYTSTNDPAASSQRPRLPFSQSMKQISTKAQISNRKRSHCSQPLLLFSAFSLFPGSGELMLRGWQPVHAAIRTVNAAVFSLSRRERAETNLWS